MGASLICDECDDALYLRGEQGDRPQSEWRQEVANDDVVLDKALENERRNDN